jgi:hypothetical protein
VPQAFFRRRSWWKDAEEPSHIDQELWRVEASSTGTFEDAHTYDIARHNTPDGWRLSLAWE